MLAQAVHQPVAPAAGATRGARAHTLGEQCYAHGRPPGQNGIDGWPGRAGGAGRAGRSAPGRPTATRAARATWGRPGAEEAVRRRHGGPDRWPPSAATGRRRPSRGRPPGSPAAAAPPHLFGPTAER
ncbi:hypothetical protein KPATCC21470_5311 [Kitasatospora purpeofusca]